MGLSLGEALGSLGCVGVSFVIHNDKQLQQEVGKPFSYRQLITLTMKEEVFGTSF